MTEGNDVKEAENKAQSVLDFTFKKLAEAITHSGKRPGGATQGAADKPKDVKEGRHDKDQGQKEDEPP